MISLIISSIFLLTHQVLSNPIAAPRPQQVAADTAPTPTERYTLEQAQQLIAQEFQQEKSDYAAYASIPAPTTYSLSPEEQAAEASIDAWFATANISDIAIESSIPASVLEELTATTGPYALPAPTDPCGPKVQTGEEWDTCTVHEDGTPNIDGSPFVWYTDEPSYYGVQCLPKPAASNDSFDSATPNLNTDKCRFEELCQDMQSGSYAKGMWHWNQNGGEGCAIGVWLPAGDGVAQVPDLVRCRDAIFGMAGLYCTAGGPQGGDGLEGSQVAAVNLRVLPGGGKSGEQVNSGYPSYIIAPEVLSS